MWFKQWVSLSYKRCTDVSDPRFSFGTMKSRPGGGCFAIFIAFPITWQNDHSSSVHLVLTEQWSRTFFMRLSSSNRRIFLGSIHVSIVSDLSPNGCLHSASEQCSCPPLLLWGYGNVSTWQDMGSSIRTWEYREWMGRVSNLFTPSPLAFPARVYVSPNHCLSLCQLSFSFIALMSSEFILFY